MNYLAFNNSSHPLYVNSTDLFHQATLSGNAYVASTNLSGSLGIAGGGICRLSNPSTNNKNICINSIYLYNSGANVLSGLTLVKDATINSPDEVTPINLNFGSTNTSTADAVYKINLIGPPSSGGTVIRTIGQIASLYATTIDSKYVLSPGTSIAVRCIATVAVSLSVYAEINYWEEAI